LLTCNLVAGELFWYIKEHQTCRIDCSLDYAIRLTLILLIFDLFNLAF
jgi:hypothetical protein